MRKLVAGLYRLPHHAYRSDQAIAGGCVIVSACDQLRLLCIPSPCIICYIFTAAGHEEHHFCSWMGGTSYVKPSIIHINSVRKLMQCHFINHCIYHWKTIHFDLTSCAWYDFVECEHEWCDIKYDTCSYGYWSIFLCRSHRMLSISLCNFVLILIVIRSQHSAQWLRVVLLKELFCSLCFSTQHVNPVVGSRQSIWTDIPPKPSFITSWILIIYIAF